MPEPAAIWSTRRIMFDREIGATQNVILMQGASALRATIRHIDRLPQMHILHADIPSILSDLCYQAGLASTILFNDATKRGPKETPAAYDLRVARTAYVRALCDERGFDPRSLRDREVRNALTHIDERLGDILTGDETKGWYIDSVIQTRNQFDPPPGITINYCRCFLASEENILHLGHELNIKNLRTECLDVLAIVFGVDGN